ncbi:MAG: ferredoxin reductase [Chloroflexota bacterium]|nr:ferredoxin reductase [Chloroflexota bacterium]
MAAPLAAPDPAVAERARWRLAEVAAIVDETPRVRGLILSVPGWPGHLPGQHLDVRLTAEDGYQAQRSYSIASPPEEPRLALVVERLEDGEVSPYLAGELRPGDALELRGPIGGYFVWSVPLGGPLLLVAGGSGVAPLMAMLRHRALAPGGKAVPATLLYSSRSFEEILFREELDRLAAADPALRVVHTLTRERPAGWTGQARRIDRAMLAEVAGPPALGTLAFVCGPTRLVEQAATDLVALGHDPARVKTERFGPTGS